MYFLTTPKLVTAPLNNEVKEKGTVTVATTVMDMTSPIEKKHNALDMILSKALTDYRPVFRHSYTDNAVRSNMHSKSEIHMHS